MMEKKQDYIGISLWITSVELSPEMITEIVGIEANYSQTRGAPIGTTKRKYERHSWNLGDRLYYAKPDGYIGEHAEKFFDSFLERLNQATPMVKALSEENSVSVAIIYNMRDMPYIGLTNSQVQAIGALGASLNYDVIVYGNSSN